MDTCHCVRTYVCADSVQTLYGMSTNLRPDNRTERRREGMSRHAGK